MTYDVTVWRSAVDLSDPNAEFERRFDESESRFPYVRTAEPELDQLAGRLETEFPGAPAWEELRGAIDGDFLYLTMTYDQDPTVEAFIAQIAPTLGLTVYSPISEALVLPGVNRPGSDGGSGYWISTRGWSVRFVA